MNYMSKWVGGISGQLVNIDEIQSLRFESIKPILNNRDGKHEIIIAMDVARSQNQNNNKTAFVIFDVNKNNNGNVRNVDVINIVTPPAGLTFLQQTIIAKRLQRMYNAKKFIFDVNGLGKGIQDFLILVNEDIETREVYDSWRIENVPDLQPEEKTALPLAFAFNASTYNNDAIINFWDYISSGRVRFLPSARNVAENPKLKEYEQIDWYNAYLQTDYLVDELSNLKVSKNGAGKFSVEQISKRVDKDRYSALIYGLWYIQHYENARTVRSTNYRDLVFYD